MYAGEQIPARCAALVVVPPGPHFLHVLKQSVASFCSPVEVTGLWVADLGTDARDLGSLGVACTATIMRMPGVPADEALTSLLEMAKAEGFTHALHGRSHEILKHAVTGEVLASLPRNWEVTDAFQAASDVVFRPLVDVLVDMRAFPTFVGPALPAPFPDKFISDGDLVVRPWPAAVVCANTHGLS